MSMVFLGALVAINLVGFVAMTRYRGLLVLVALAMLLASLH